MKNILLVLFIAAIGIVGIGFYRGWFATETSTTGSKSNVNLSVDRDKIKEDMNSMKKHTGTASEKKDPIDLSSPPK